MHGSDAVRQQQISSSVRVRFHCQACIAVASFARRCARVNHMIKSWLVCALALWLTSKWLPDFSIKGVGGALKVAALFGILNWAIGWLIYVMLGIASLGLGFIFAFVTRTIANAILLKVTDAIADSLKIKGFTPAVVGALSISVIGSVVDLLLRHQGHFGWL